MAASPLAKLQKISKWVHIFFLWEDSQKPEGVCLTVRANWLKEDVAVGAANEFIYHD